MSDNRILPNTNSNVEYVLKFGEAYGTTGTTIYPDLHVTGTKYLWNAVFDYEEIAVYSSGDYMTSSGSPCAFLTNKPSSGDIMSDDNAWLYWNDINLNTVSFYIVTRMAD
jgi:hypothetical protein